VGHNAHLDLFANRDDYLLETRHFFWKTTETVEDLYTVDASLGKALLGGLVPGTPGHGRHATVAERSLFAWSKGSSLWTRCTLRNAVKSCRCFSSLAYGPVAGAICVAARG
jgi:hypothetical protein